MKHKNPLRKGRSKRFLWISLGILIIVIALTYPVKRWLQSRVVSNQIQQSSRNPYNHRSNQPSPQLKTLLERQSEATHTYCKLAEATITEGDYKSALKHAQLETSIAPNCFRGHFIAGFLFSKLNQPKFAEQELKRALQLQPNSKDALLLLSGLLVENSDLTEGTHFAKILTQKHPQVPHGHYYLGWCYRRNPTIPDYLYKSEESLKRTIKLAPRHHGGHLELGRVYVQTKQFSKAENHLKTASRIKPDHAPTMKDLATVYRELNRPNDSNQAQKRYEHMSRLFIKAEALKRRRAANPYDPTLARQLADILYEQGKFKDAEELRRSAGHWEKNPLPRPTVIPSEYRNNFMPDDIQPSKPNDLFTDITEEAGITFVHTNGGWGRRYFLEETGSGCALFDFDNDNWLDIFILQAGQVPGTSQSGSTQGSDGNHLYRNNRDGTFSNVTEGSGLQHTGYGQGVAVADYDNDNFDDLLITAYGRNFLFRNEGGTGKFTDVTQHAGLTPTDGESHWSTSCAFGDYDKDGDLDLFISRYVKWTLHLDVDCFDPTTKKRGYCSPLQYDPTTDVLYRNNGDSTFTDITQEAGLGELKGKGLATAWLDFNKDGFQDLFVACDLTPDFLLRNNQDGTFTDVALEAGVAYSDGGLALAGMGIGIGDYNNDGFEDLFVTNFSKQGNFLHHNDGNGFFTNRSYPSRVAPISMKFLGFGCEFLDFDCDGFKDILVANGHVSDDIEETERGINYAQRQSLYHNNGDNTFSDTTENLGALTLRRVSRGLAIGDIDNDGDIDALFNNQNAPPQLLRNNYRAKNHWVSFKLSGTRTHKNARHAKVTIHANGLSQYAEVRSGSSYCSHSDTRLTFGLGTAETVDKLEVAWFNGETESFQDIPADNIWHIVEGQGKMNKIPSSSLPLTLP